MRYALLIYTTAGSPVVALNLAAARADCGDVAGGLAIADGVAAPLDGYRYLHWTRGELLARLGQRPAAADAFRALWR